MQTGVCSQSPHIQELHAFTSDYLKKNTHTKLNIQSMKPKRNTNKTGKKNEKITELKRFVWQLRRQKRYDNGN